MGCSLKPVLSHSAVATAPAAPGGSKGIECRVGIMWKPCLNACPALVLAEPPPLLYMSSSFKDTSINISFGIESID